ncbi:MAG TPA: SpoIID/LytB domain-containing protein, partial [Vicinamibacterales bacterium]
MKRLLMLVAVMAFCTAAPALDGSSPPSRPPLVSPNASVTELRIGIAIPGGGYHVETMPLEHYVARVLAGEAARDSQPAALEALATTVRTFALANLGRHRADGFDLCDQTHCQVVRAATVATERAAEATAGRILVRDTTTRAAASVYYTASCGGRTEVPSAVWPGAEDPSFLPSKRDDACGGSPAWTADLSESDLLRAFHAAGFQGHRLESVSIASRDGSGRAAMLKLDGLRPDHISGQDLRVAVGRTLGWQFIKSTAFELRRAGDAYRFSGHGSGHGVGLCVIGSARLAERGQTAEDILARYFPGLTIVPAREVRSGSERDRSRTGVGPERDRNRTGVGPEYDRTRTGGVALALPEGDEGEREAITRLVTRARDELAATLHVTPPPMLTLRFHPTTDDYERATGQAWFTSATIVGNELHLLPLAVLRDRGVLDRTIRHSLVHALIDSALVNRPLWVREGAATYFGGAPPISGHPAERPPFRPSPRASCPADAELANPVS